MTQKLTVGLKFGGFWRNHPRVAASHPSSQARKHSARSPLALMLPASYPVLMHVTAGAQRVYFQEALAKRLSQQTRLSNVALEMARALRGRLANVTRTTLHLKRDSLSWVRNCCKGAEPPPVQSQWRTLRFKKPSH